MASSQPIMAFLRPLALPRPATVRHFLRFSQSTKSTATADVDRNLIASQTASPSYPPPSVRSLPRPKESHASHRASQPVKARNYPDRVANQKTLFPKADRGPPRPLPESQVAPNLPYFVTRTPSNELPIYTLTKRGGNLLQTRVKKIDGNVDILRDALQAVLRVPENECVINRTTGHVVIKGFHKPRIESFLKARNF